MFSKLNTAEKHVLAALGQGKPARFTKSAPPGRRTLRGSFLRALLLESYANWPDAYPRLALENAIILGSFSFAQVRRRKDRDGPIGTFCATDCAFLQAPDLTDSRFESLHLVDCEMPGFVAPRLHVLGDLTLERCTIKGAADLRRAQVTGLLNAEGLNVEGPLDLDRIRAGEIVLDLATVGGRVNLEMCRVDGMLAFDGASVGDVHKPDEVSLNLNGAQVGGDLFLRSHRRTMAPAAANWRRFVAEGMIDAVGAVVRGGVEIHDAALRRGAADYALDLGRLETNGCLFLRSHRHCRLEVDGAIHLEGARIGGYARICGADLTPTSKPGCAAHDLCLDLDGATITNFLQMGELSGPGGVVRPEGRFSLVGTRIGMLHDDPRTAWPRPGQLNVTGFVYDLISPDGDKDAEERLHWLREHYTVYQRPRPFNPKLAGRLRQVGLALRSRAATELRRRDRRVALRRKFSPQPFEQLASVLRKMGYTQIADEVAILKREAQATYGAEPPWRRFASRFMSVTSRHGYSPIRAIGWTMAWWLFGAWLLTAALAGGFVQMKPDSGAADKVNYVAWAGDRPWNRHGAVDGCGAAVVPLYVLETIVPGLDIGQADACKIEVEGLRAGVFTGLRALFQIIGGVLAAVTVTTLTGILRRD